MLVHKYFTVFEKNKDENESDANNSDGNSSKLSSLSEGNDRDGDLDELNDDTNDLVSEANRIKQDFHAIISNLVDSSTMITQLTLQYVYTGYLYGIGKVQEALTHSSTVYKNLKEQIDSQYADTPLFGCSNALLGKCMYYHLYTEEMCRNSNETRGEASKNLNIVNTMTWVSNDLDCMNALYVTYLLKNFRYITDENYVKILADSFERRCSLVLTDHGHEAEGKLFWSLCRNIALTIGPPCSSTIDTQRQIQRDCSLAAHLPADCSLLTDENVVHANLKENYLNDRKWWNHTILSFDQLGDMQCCVSVDIVDMITASLTEHENTGAIGDPCVASSEWFWPDTEVFDTQHNSASAHTTFAQLYSSFFQEVKITPEKLQDCSNNDSGTVFDRFSGTLRLQSEEIYDTHYPSAAINAAKSEISCPSFQHLSNMLLEQLTFQIIISTYVNDGNQDNLFVICGIQLLLKHALYAYINESSNACVLECLSLLRRSNINITRSTVLANAIVANSTPKSQEVQNRKGIGKRTKVR